LLTTRSATDLESPNYGQRPAKYHRPRPLARLSLPEIAVLGHLGDYPLLTSKRLQRIAGWSQTHADTTLAELYDKGLIDKGLVPRPLTTEQKRRRRPPNKPENIWRLTRSGAKRGKKEGVISEQTPAPPQRWDGDFIGAANDIKHRLKIIDVMYEIRHHIDLLDGRSLEFLKPDFIKEERGKERVRQTRDMVSKSETITPDLIGKTWNDVTGQSALLFIEVQRTRLPGYTENPKQSSITSRLAQYGRYFCNQKRLYRGADQSIVLFIFEETTVQIDKEHIDYIDHIHSNIRWDEIGDAASQMLLSTFSRIETGIFGPIWRNRGNEIVGLV